MPTELRNSQLPEEEEEQEEEEEEKEATLIKSRDPHLAGGGLNFLEEKT